jgi:hypothetical protein
MKKNLTQIKIGISLFVSGALMIGFGHACSQYTSDGTGTLIAQGEEDRIVLNEKTVSTVYANQVLDNMVSCLGVGQVSANTRRLYQDIKQSVSERGSAKEITAPMLMGLTSLAGQVCSELVAKESNLSQKRIFVGYDFDGNAVSDYDIEDSVSRLARSCWLRNESNEERNAIMDAINENFGNGDSVEDIAIFACTAVVASFDSIQL